MRTLDWLVIIIYGVGMLGIGLYFSKKSATSKDYMLGGSKMKPWTVRMPEAILDWLREKAALETIRQKRQVSMNTVIVEILTKAMETEKKKGG